MGRQGYSDIIVSKEVHHELSIMKARLKLRSMDSVLKELLRSYPKK